MSVLDVTNGQSFATLSAAIAASSAGDVLQVPAGIYVENFPNITHNLTITSTGGMAYLSNPQPDPPNGRAVVNVPGNLNVSLTLSGLDISGAVDDASNPPSNGGANGAGILFETGNGALTVSNCHIHNNEDGILAGAANSYSTHGLTVTITHSEFDHNGVPSTNVRYGYDHNLYIGAVTQFSLADSYIHDALGGNEVKSRALASTIENNRIQDQGSPSSYEIDLADGGNDVVKTNTIQKGPNSPQEHVVDFGAEGTYAGSTLTFSGNTIINNGGAPYFSNPTAVWNATNDPGTGTFDIGQILNNTLYGITTLDQVSHGSSDDLSGNTLLPITLAPPLDTAGLFGVPAPPSIVPVMIAALTWVRARRRFRRRRRAKNAGSPTCGPVRSRHVYCQAGR